jgi:hypothetical protein
MPAKPLMVAVEAMLAAICIYGLHALMVEPICASVRADGNLQSARIALGPAAQKLALCSSRGGVVAKKVGL